MKHLLEILISNYIEFQCGKKTKTLKVIITSQAYVLEPKQVRKGLLKVLITY